MFWVSFYLLLKGIPNNDFGIFMQSDIDNESGEAEFCFVMLVSHCGEYHCECKKIYSRQIRQIVANIWRMGLRMQFATNRNDRKMIARYS